MSQKRLLSFARRFPVFDFFDKFHKYAPSGTGRCVYISDAPFPRRDSADNSRQHGNNKHKTERGPHVGRRIFRRVRSVKGRLVDNQRARFFKREQ